MAAVPDNEQRNQFRAESTNKEVCPWLDSLSEDWNSQPGSCDSPGSLNTPSPGPIFKSRHRNKSSRIPRFNHKEPLDTKNEPKIPEKNEPAMKNCTSMMKSMSNSSPKPQSPPTENNTANIQSLSTSTSSASSTGSVKRHNIIRDSRRHSSTDNIQFTHEWRKKSAIDDLAINDKLDLFSGPCLEGIFKSPFQNSIPFTRPSVEEQDDIAARSQSKSLACSGQLNFRPRKAHLDKRSFTGEFDKLNLRTSCLPSDIKNEASSSTNIIGRNENKAEHESRNISQEKNAAPVDIETHERGLDTHTQRILSGYSISMNEQLSQIILEKQSTEDGLFRFAPANPLSRQALRKLDHISEEKSENSPYKQHHNYNANSSQPATIVKENSTQKSSQYFNSLEGFKKSALQKSPLSLSDESALPEESLQASTPKEILNSRTICVNTNFNPKKSSSKIVGRQSNSLNRKVNNELGNTPRSPLKIFGTHDTFTNEKLLRRLSQFEYELKDQEGSLTPKNPENTLTSYELNKKLDGITIMEKTDVSERNQIQGEKKISEIDQNKHEKLKVAKKDISDQSEIKFCQNNEKILRLSHDSKSSSAFETNPYPSLFNDNLIACTPQIKPCKDNPLNKTNNNLRKKSKPFISSPLSTGSSSLRKKDQQRSLRNKNGYLDGKRLPKTPLRHPDAKRRRTFQRMEFDGKPMVNGETKFGSLIEAHYKMHSITHQNQKNPIQDKSQQTVNTKNYSIPSTIDQKNNNYSQQNPKIPNILPLVSKESAVTNNADLTSTQLNRGELQRGQSFSDSVSQAQINSRKFSFPSEDFIETAKKIMCGLREKARSQKVSASAEQSKLSDYQNCSYQKVSLDDRSDNSYQGSTEEFFLRPPSHDREAPVPRLPHEQKDPTLLEYLRKYYEDDDLDALVASSLKSISNAKENSEIAKQVNRFTEEKVMKASIRRSASPNRKVEKRTPINKASEVNDDKNDMDSTFALRCRSMSENLNDYLSFRSYASSGQSTTFSMPTGSSRGSDHRRVIAPKSVSHLIPEQLAGMVFDRGLNKWVKKKTSEQIFSENVLVSEDTEDDPFGDIPDLSVDETQERERIHAILEKQNDDSNLPNKCNGRKAQCKLAKDVNHNGNFPTEEYSQNLTVSPSLSPLSKSPEKDSHRIRPMKVSGSSARNDGKIANLKTSHSQDSFPQLENTPSLPKLGEKIIGNNEKKTFHQNLSSQNRTSKQRNITISFSSPIASFIETQKYDDQISIYNDDGFANNMCDISDTNDMNREHPNKENNHGHTNISSKPVSSREFCRKSSVGGHSFPARPVSRIDERDEDTPSHDGEDDNSNNLSIVLTSTSAPIKIPMGHNTPIPIREIGTLTLTPLSDFTTHQADESFGLDVSYLPYNHQPEVEKTKKTLSLSIKELVSKITEVEPFEPYWEHLKEISLKDKCLKSVHKLDEFCERLMDLDISCNQISTLDGVPRTVQILNISNNFLSNMTAWGHLINLQYVDVSSNNLDSLSSLRCLFHMRSLRADHNKISSLDGIDQLEGLLSLRLRDNLVHTLNFHDSKLQLLTDLDLRGNQISKVENIQRLRSLTKLDLVDNNLSEFSLDKTESLGSIKYLKLSGNNLKCIDVSNFPNLRVLYLDRNRLGRLSGLIKAKYLDSLSLREQRGSTIDQRVFSEAFEVRKLFLSGNFLAKLELESDFLNLQYLELANCGLEYLPANFGTMLANVRVLNLNFNALTDIHPLKGILRLKRLHLVGNRLLGLDNLSKVLSELPTLSSVDLRSNPTTMGFYSPILEREISPYATTDLDEKKCQEPYKMAKMNKSKDDFYTSCLDMRTRMKRRIYEMFLIHSTHRLKMLDGLPVDRSILFKYDEVHRSMVKAGFISRPYAEGKSLDVEEGDTKKEFHETPNDEVWHAEDSFG